MLAITLLTVATPQVLSQGLTLSDALVAARQHDAQYQGAVGNLQASREAGVQGRAAFGPEIGLAASLTGNQLELTAGPATRRASYPGKTVALQLRQPLFSAELAARRREGEARSRQGDAVFADQSARLTVRLVEAYANVPLADELLATANAQIAALEEQARSAARLRASGEGTVTDELEARSRLGLARVKAVEALNARAEAVSRLRVIVGSLDRVPRSLTPDFAGLPLVPDDLAHWERLALERSPEVQARSEALAAARHALDRAGAQRSPRLDAVASISRSESESINTIDQSAHLRTLGVQLNIPLYDHGRNDSQVRQASAAVATAQAALDDALASVLADLRLRHRTLQSERQKIQAYADALEAARLQVEATRRSVKGGVRTTLDVLNAQAQSYAVQQELTLARFNHLKAWFRFKAAAGVLDEADLLLADQHLR